jgi:cytochrome-b5 reductase
VIRSYTPINADDTQGHIDFAIKIYMKNQHPKFPAGGKMSQHLNSLNIGDSMAMRGPKGHVTYHGTYN